MNTTRTRITLAKYAILLAALSLLSACGGSAEEAGASEAATLPAGVENQVPTLSGAPHGEVKVMVGEDFEVQPQASDPDGDPLSFSISNKPRWAQFESESGRLRGRPATGDVGRYARVIISVTDGMDTTQGEPFDVTVDDTGTTINRVPVLTGTPATSVYAGSQYSFRPGASDADGDTLVFSVENLPSWAAFDSSNGTLSGNPGTGNIGTTRNIRIGASDGTATTYTPNFEVTVMAVETPPANSAPSLSGTPASSVLTGQFYSYTPVASDADGDALTFSIQNLPIWANFNAATGALSGTPAEIHVGANANIRISVSDGVQTTAGAVFSIHVLTSNRAPTIAGTPASSVDAGQAYHFVPTAADADGDNLRFSVQNRPSWASFNAATGELGGTPDEADVGTYSNIRISVSDGTASVSTSAFSIRVVGQNRAPTLSGTPAASVRAGESYRFQPTAADADGDTLSFSVQNLPSWAAFDASTGAISGSPGDGDVGSYGNIRIVVSDGTVSTNGVAFSIEVTQVSLGQATLSWTAPSENMDGSALTDLAGYKLYYGTSEGNYTETITVDNPGILTYVVDNLTPSTYYFVATAYNSTGVESPFSGVAVKVVE